jgi:hypothetical protein
MQRVKNNIMCLQIIDSYVLICNSLYGTSVLLWVGLVLKPRSKLFYMLNK